MKYRIKALYECLHPNQRSRLRRDFFTRFDCTRDNFYKALKSDYLKSDQILFFCEAFGVSHRDLYYDPPPKARKIMMDQQLAIYVLDQNFNQQYKSVHTGIPRVT